MIYLLDQKLTEKSHSRFIIDIIAKHSNVEVKLIVIPDNPTYGQLYDIINNLYPIVKPFDVVLCPWAVDGDAMIDEMFNHLSELCWVVVAAGNFNEDIEKYSPARAEKVITVACFNKAGVKAALSNWSKDKELVWVCGYNVDVIWKKGSGTSASAAIYASFLAESIIKQDPELLEKLMEEHKAKVYQEMLENAKPKS